MVAKNCSFQSRSSSSALPSRSTPALKFSGSQQIPTRMCCGDSKNRPGATEVSYFSISKEQSFSTSTFRTRGKDVVPNFVGTTSTSSSVLENFLHVYQF